MQTVLSRANGYFENNSEEFILMKRLGRRGLKMSGTMHFKDLLNLVHLFSCEDHQRVKEIVRNGLMDVDQLSHDGRTALIFRAQEEDEEGIELLLSLGADTTLTYEGKTAWHWAIEKGFDDICVMFEIHREDQMECTEGYDDSSEERSDSEYSSRRYRSNSYSLSGYE